MRYLFAALAACLPFLPALAADPPAKTVFVPERRGVEYDTWHYAPAVRVGDLVILSGIPAVGPGTYRDQVKRMFAATARTLEAAGASMADVVEIQTFHANAKTSEAFAKELEEFLAVHKEHFVSAYPAWTAIGNATLLSPGAAVEMRVMAMAGSGRNAKVERAPAAK